VGQRPDSGRCGAVSRAAGGGSAPGSSKRRVGAGWRRVASVADFMMLGQRVTVVHRVVA
jgi:hypothetical protein